MYINYVGIVINGMQLQGKFIDLFFYYYKYVLILRKDYYVILKLY